MDLSPKKTYKQVVLLILDGWGYRKDPEYNAISYAKNFAALWEKYPHTLFPASGEPIGLPKGNIGTSELGHTILGAGTIPESYMEMINNAIKNNTLKDNENLQKLFSHVKEHDSTLHLFGQLSPGGVHSHQDHLFAIIRCAKNAGINKIAVHVFTDGRDVPPMSEEIYLKDLDGVFEETKVGRVSTMIGRFFAMDRDTNWDRVQKAVDMIFEGKGDQYSDKTPIDVINQFHKKGVEDQYIEPSVFLTTEGKAETIQQNDGVMNFNFRADRAREISQKVAEKAENMNICFATLTEYDPTIKSLVIFQPYKIRTTLSEQVSNAGLSQVHIAETEKYAHVTYFFNGGVEQAHKNEEFVMIPSHKDVQTHDLAPHMRAEEIADRTIAEINNGTNLMIVNICNADMVGHTGKWEPTVEAVKFEDMQIQRIADTILAKDGVMFITADHGNAEIMYDEKNHQPHTAHTLDPIPGILTEEGVSMPEEGSMADVAPTILNLLGLKVPSDMTGHNLIK